MAAASGDAPSAAGPWGHGPALSARGGCARLVPYAGTYVRTFGGFALCRERRVVPAAAWRRQAAKYLLVRLLLAGAGGVSRQVLCGELWPEVPEAAAANCLRVTLHALRRTLEPGLAPRRPSRFLLVDRYGCALAAQPVLRWDGGELEQGLRLAAAATDPRAEEAALRRALHGVSGPWLPEMDACGALAGARWRLHELAGGAAVRLAELALQRRAPATALAALTRALAIDPGTEEAYALLLRAAAQTGRPGQVRRAFAFAADQLREHAGLSPGEGLRRLAAEALAEAEAQVGVPRSRRAYYQETGRPRRQRPDLHGGGAAPLPSRAAVVPAPHLARASGHAARP